MLPLDAMSAMDMILSWLGMVVVAFGVAFLIGYFID